MNKIFDLLNLFRKGAEISNAEAWKDGGNAATLLAPLIMLAVKVAGDFGYGVQLSTEDATSIAFGTVALVQFVIHNITSKRAGVLPAKPDSQGDSVSGEAGKAQEADVQPVADTRTDTTSIN